MSDDQSANIKIIKNQFTIAVLDTQRNIAQPLFIVSLIEAKAKVKVSKHCEK